MSRHSSRASLYSFSRDSQPQRPLSYSPACRFTLDYDDSGYDTNHLRYSNLAPSVTRNSALTKQDIEKKLTLFIAFMSKKTPLFNLPNHEGLLQDFMLYGSADQTKKLLKLVRKAQQKFETQEFKDCDHNKFNDKVGINAIDKKGKTPLDYAVIAAEIDIINLLFACGAKLSIGTPLHYAAGKNKLPITPFDASNPYAVSATLPPRTHLLGSNFNFRTQPLDSAKQNNFAIAMLLFKEEKHLLNSVDEKNKTPLNYAIDTNQPELVKLFLNKGAHVNPLSFPCEIPLYSAIKLRSKEMVELLINERAEVNVKKDSESILYRATKSAAGANIILLLIHAGARITWDNGLDCYRNESPLNLAARNGDAKVFQLLLEVKSDIDFTGSDGQRLLRDAVKGNNVNIVSRLLKLGAGAKPEHCNDPLYYPIKHGNANIAQQLIDANLNVNSKNKDGTTALSFAVSQGQTNIVDLLFKHDAKASKTELNSYLCIAVSKNYAGIVKLLLNEGAGPNIDMLNYPGETVLSFAVSQGQTKIVDLLFEHDAKPSEIKLNSYLCIAVNKNYPGIVKLLLNKGADPKTTMPNRNRNVTAFEITVDEYKLDLMRAFFESSRTPVALQYFDEGAAGEKKIKSSERRQSERLNAALQGDIVMADYFDFGDRRDRDSPGMTETELHAIRSLLQTQEMFRELGIPHDLGRWLMWKHMRPLCLVFKDKTLATFEERIKPTSGTVSPADSTSGGAPATSTSKRPKRSRSPSVFTPHEVTDNVNTSGRLPSRASINS